MTGHRLDDHNLISNSDGSICLCHHVSTSVGYYTVSSSCMLLGFSPVVKSVSIWSLATISVPRTKLFKLYLHPRHTPSCLWCGARQIRSMSSICNLFPPFHNSKLSLFVLTKDPINNEVRTGQTVRVLM